MDRSLLSGQWSEFRQFSKPIVKRDKRRIAGVPYNQSMVVAGERRRPARTRFSRGAYAVSGCAFVGLGTLGIFLPVVPTTIFFILALWCFKKSNRRLESWLLNHRVVGPTLRDWEETGSVTARTKVIAITLLWVAIGVSCVLVTKVWVQAMLLATAGLVTWYLLSRPTKAPDAALSRP